MYPYESHMPVVWWYSVNETCKCCYGNQFTAPACATFDGASNTIYMVVYTY